MITRHLTTVVGVSSFCLGIWLDRKFREYNSNRSRIPGFQIFDAVHADNSVANNHELIANNEQRISQVRRVHLNTVVSYYLRDLRC